jgi:protein-disulfide isomerase
MRPIVRSGLVPALVLASLLAACERERPESAAPAEEKSATPDADVVAGRIGGKDVSVSDVDAWIMDKLFANATNDRQPSRLYEIRSRALKQMASEQGLEAEAAKQSLQREELLRRELEKRASVTPEEVKAFYEQNKQRYGQRTFEQLEAPIKRQLEQQKRQKEMEAYFESLRQSVGFEERLEPPRFKIAGDGNARGPADAPVTLVEFSDYECPFCKNAEAVVAEVLERYPTQVRFVYRHFPLDQIHKQARTAALAAECADAQGKFWEYHQALFEGAPKLAEADLKTYADAVGLDRAAFDPCLAQQQPMATIGNDIDAGDKAGVRGTPAFFVNGLPLSGGRSLADFAAVIDRELERLGQPVPPPPAAPTAAATPTPMPPPAAPPAAAPAPAPAAPPPAAPPARAPAAPPAASPPAPGPAGEMP